MPPDRKPSFATPSGIPVPPYLDASALPDDFEALLGAPGAYPYTRGIHPGMYRSRLWTMRQYAGYASAEESNARYRFLLEQGQSGLSVAFDLPTQIGYDADDPMALGEVGKVGVSISSVHDMARLFEGIPLDQVSTSMTINAPAAVLLAMYIVVGRRQGVREDQLRGTVQNDILKEYIAQKEFIFPPRPSMRLVIDTIEFAARHMPKWNPISISGYHIREAGSTAAQELAFTLADGLEYVRWSLARGLDIDDFAPRLSFFFNAHNDFFEEIAKYRAARRIWATEMRDTFGAQNPRSWWLRFHSQTAGVSLTAQQPENNIVRTAIQALAAVMGGTQSLHTNSMDEALALPSEMAVRIALRTQQIIAHESGVVNTIDPLGGSYFVEALTDEMERQARRIFAEIEAQGGVIPALEKGYFQRAIADAAARYQREIDAGERTIVGVNDYVSDEPLQIPILAMDPQGYDVQVARLNRVRRERDNDLVQRRLEQLRNAAEDESVNLMPLLLDAVRAYATLGEMMTALRQVFGEYMEPTIV